VALAAIVFQDEPARRDLEAIVHPIVAAEVRARLRAADRPGQVVVVDIPLLVETDGRARHGLDGVLVVEAPLEQAVARVVAARGLDPADVRARAAAQATAAERMRVADFVILNEGTMAELEAMTERAWRWILRLLAEGGEELSGVVPLRD
jgi:dephospho-CoA kinase